MSKPDNSSRNLYLTPLNRIVIADHNGEVFLEPYDILIATKEELSNGIKKKDFLNRIIEARERGLSEQEKQGFSLPRISTKHSGAKIK